MGAAIHDIVWRYSDDRMALCPVDPMDDAPMISALHKDWALPLAGAGLSSDHSPSDQPSNRATGQRSIRVGPDGCLCMAGTDGRMAVCPVDPMNDDPMISAMLKDCALPLAGAGLSSDHFPSEQPSIRTSEHRIGHEGCHCMARTDGRMAVCPVGLMNADPMMSALPKD